MKFEFEIPEETLHTWVKHATADFINDEARRFIARAVEDTAAFSTQVRVDLYEELKAVMARHLNVKGV